MLRSIKNIFKEHFSL